MDNGLFSSKSKKIWWSKLKSSFSSKKGINSKRRDGEDVSLCEKLNVNEEYTGVLRTQSYIEICNKVQVQLTESPKPTLHKHSSSSSLSSSPSSSSSSSSLSSFSSSSSFQSSTSATLPFYNHLSDLLLEPRQEAIIDIIKSSKLQTLLIGYFDASLEAYNMCESLLKGLHKTRSNHRRIKRVIKLSQEIEKGENNDFNMEQCHELVLQELDSYASLSNPLSHTIDNDALDFPMFHDKYTLLLRKLTSRRRKIKRMEKFRWFYKKAAKYGLLITYIVLVITLVILAAHSMVGLLGAPGLLLPFSIGIIKKLKDGNGGSLNVNFLKHLGSQLDVAAKGIYIFINDFDTVGRLVTRLHDEVQHKREIAAMCVRNWKSHDVVIREALREFQNHEQGFDEQLQELEQHIYLCLLTINRSRRLVLEEILAPLNN